MRTFNSKLVTMVIVVAAQSLASVQGFRSTARLQSLQTRTPRRASTKMNANSEAERIGSQQLQQPQSNWFQWPQQSKQLEQEPANLRNDEEDVDEYLEFLDRRYRRLHDDEKKSAESPKPAFSAWNWLKQEQEHAEKTQGESNQDALFVLGVAGLASKKLLHKHHIDSLDGDNLQSLGDSALDVPSYAPVENMTPTTKASLLVAEVEKVIRRVSTSRRSIHKYQSRKLKSTATMLAKAPVRVSRSLWQLGGGQKTVKVSVSCAIALTFVLVKPLAQFIASEGVNITRGA